MIKFKKVKFSQPSLEECFMKYQLPDDLAEMPCQPCEIRFPKYALPMTIGKAESEEAAARIISFSQEAGEWTGVSWNQIIKMMKRDYEDYDEKDPRAEPPFSGIFLSGPRYVVIGIQELLEKDFLRKEKDTAEGTDVFYPTPYLIDFLLSCQTGR